jgi:hypothetical protein
MKENDKIAYIFVNPKTQSFGEILYNNSSESIVLKYDDIMLEIKKYCSNNDIIKQSKEYIKLYKSFLISLINNTITEMTATVSPEKVKKHITEVCIKNKVKEKLNVNNPRSIKNLESKLNNIINKDMTNSRFSGKPNRNFF